MIENIVGILLIFILAWISVRWKIFSAPLSPRPDRTEEKIHEEAKSKVVGKSLDDSINDLNARYPDNEDF